MVRESDSYIACCPGETIVDQLEIDGITPEEFIDKTCISRKAYNELIEGDVKLSYDMATRIVSVVGVYPNFWLKLDARYWKDLKLVQEENARMKEQAVVTSAYKGAKEGVV